MERETKQDDYTTKYTCDCDGAASYYNVARLARGLRHDDVDIYEQEQPQDGAIQATYPRSGAGRLLESARLAGCVPSHRRRRFRVQLSFLGMTESGDEETKSPATGKRRCRPDSRRYGAVRGAAI